MAKTSVLSSSRTRGSMIAIIGVIGFHFKPWVAISTMDPGGSTELTVEVLGRDDSGKSCKISLAIRARSILI